MFVVLLGVRSGTLGRNPHGLHGGGRAAKNTGLAARTLGVGRPQGQAEALMRAAEAFESMDPDRLGELPATKAGQLLEAIGHDPKPLRTQLAMFTSRMAGRRFCFLELCGPRPLLPAARLPVSRFLPCLEFLPPPPCLQKVRCAQPSSRWN